MSKIAGIKFERTITGKRRYVRIDLNRYGNNELLEDFLDGLEAESRKDEGTVPFDEVVKKLERKHKTKFD